MVNYNLNSAPAKVVKPVTDAELMESIENVAAAAEALVDAGVAVEHVVQCMDNVQLALTAIQNGGVTKQMLKTFNGCGELSALLGQENLTPAGLESFADAQIAKVTSIYVEGLEGKLDEYWSKFVAWLKNLWIKMKNWFITVWQNRAKWFKSLDGVKSMKEFNGDAEVEVMSFEAYGKLNALQDKIVKGLNDFKQTYTRGGTETGKDLSGKEYTKTVGPDRVSTFDGAITEFNNELDAALKDAVKSGKLTSERGWDLLKLQTNAAKIANATAANGQMADHTKWITGALELLVKKAGEAGKLDDDTKKAVMKEQIQLQRKALASALAAVRLENRIVNIQFSALHKVMKAAQTKKESK